MATKKAATAAEPAATMREVNQDDLDALSYAHRDIAEHLKTTLDGLTGKLSDDEIGPLRDAQTRLEALSVQVLNPTG